MTFDEAATVFVDPLALRFDDPDHSQWEDRFLLLGMSDKWRVLLVVYTAGAEGDDDSSVVRIISARKATASERRAYEEAERENFGS